MTRDEFIRDLECADDIFHGEDFSSYAKRLATHDAEQRAEIERLQAELARLKSELSHWTWVRFKQLEEQNAMLREALQLLHDHQNGCPLPSYEEGWTRAMVLTQRALREQS